MSDAVSVDESPVTSDPEQVQDDDTPVVQLPGQMTFGWGDEPEVFVPRSGKKKKSGKSKKSKSAITDKSSSSKTADDTVIAQMESSESQRGKSKSSKKRKKTGKVTVSKPARSTKKKAARKGPVERKAGTAVAQETSVASDPAVDPSSDSATDTKATTKAALAKRTKKKRVPASRKTPPKRSASGADAASSQGSARASAEVPKQVNAPKTKTIAEPQAAPETESYAGAVDYLPLKWGAKLPSVGFGFWKVEKDQTAQVCYDAIQVGYRHLDCACDYGNEEEVGQGIQRAISDGLVDREDLWVTSKLWNTYHAAEHVRMACEKSLTDLQLDYLDLYLIHFPLAQRYVPIETRYPPGWFFDPDVANPVVEEARVPVQETWQALEELTKEGLVRNIGICNFGTSQIRDLLTYAHIRPAVLQVETHPRLTQPKLLRYCQQEKIAYTAFSPLGAQSYYSLNMADPSESLLEHAVVKEIADQVERTAAQVLLRWGVQRGTAVIPKTSSKERMVENIRIFDFELSAEQIRQLDALDEGRRFNDPGDFGEAAFNTYLPIYE